MKTALLTVATIMVIVSFSIAVAAFVSTPPHQVRADEICVNAQCHKGPVNISIVYDSEATMRLYVSRSGKTLDLPVIAHHLVSGKHVFVLEHQRGFFSIGQYDQTAFLYVDGDQVTFHVTHSTFK